MGSVRGAGQSNRSYLSGTWKPNTVSSGGEMRSAGKPQKRRAIPESSKPHHADAFLQKPQSCLVLRALPKRIGSPLSIAWIRSFAESQRRLPVKTRRENGCERSYKQIEIELAHHGLREGRGNRVIRANGTLTADVPKYSTICRMGGWSQRFVVH